MLNVKKNFLNSFTVFFLFLIVLLAMVFINPSVSTAAGEPIKARLSYHWFPQHQSAIYANKFAEECNKATNGKLKIEVFHSGQLFDIRQALSAVSSGSVELAGVLDLNFVPIDKNFMLGSFGYFWHGYEKQREFWTNNPVGKAKWEGIQKKLGIKILCYDPVGPSAMFSTKPMNGTVEELKSRKIRYLTAGEKPGYEALGMGVVSVSTSEMFSALKQGMIDTFVTNPSALKAYSWWDIAQYGVLPYTGYTDAFIVANARWWDSLPKDVQQTILTKVAPKISKDATDSVISYSNDILKEFKETKGGKIVSMSKSELKKINQIYATRVWPVLGKDMDPQFYEAAMKFMGYK